jgi:soluble lytic murein transglycosylase-like protein
VRGRAGFVAAALTAGLLLPGGASALPGLDDDLEAEIARARDEHDAAVQQLAAVEERVRRAGDELAAADERARRAATELDQVRRQLDDARRAAEAATAAEREAAARLADVDAELAGLVADVDDHRRRLEARAVQAYKQGSVLPHDLLVRGVSGAQDWHEVTVTLETVGRLARADRELADDTAALTRSTAALRAAAGEARAAAVATARAAAAERRRVEEIEARQERAVAASQAEQEHRSAVLSALEADAEARATLVATLAERVAELEAARLPVLVPIVHLEVDGPPPPWAHRLPLEGRPYAAAIDAAGGRVGVDGRLLAALVWTESSFRPDAVSHAGALGLAQLMPDTARGLGVDPRDPLRNLDGGARYLRAQLDRFGRVDLALAAYNAGPGRVQAAGGVPDIVETQLYVVRVLDRYRAIAGA